MEQQESVPDLVDRAEKAEVELEVLVKVAAADQIHKNLAGTFPQVEMAEDTRNETTMQPNSGISASRICQENTANMMKNRNANSSMDQ